MKDKRIIQFNKLEITKKRKKGRLGNFNISSLYIIMAK